MIPSMAANESGYSYTFIDHTKMNGDRYYRLKIVKTLISGSEVFNIDVSGLNRGEYFLSVSQGKNFHATKFFKQ